MKNWKKFIGIFALVVVIGFFFIACGEDDEGDESSASLGATLNLSGQVYDEHWDGNSALYVPYTGTVETLSNYRYLGNSNWDKNGGSGKIENGQLSFSIGTPDHLMNVVEIFEELDELKNFKISNTDANSASLNLGTGSRWLGREYISYTSTSETYESVSYVYVDRDITISAERTVFTDEDGGFSWTETYNAFNINLKTGWNAVSIKCVEIETATSETEEWTYSATIPSHLRWVMWN